MSRGPRSAKSGHCGVIHHFASTKEEGLSSRLSGCGPKNRKWRPSRGKKRVVWRIALTVSCKARFDSENEKHLKLALIFGLNTTPRLELEQVLRAMIDRLGNIDLAGCTRGFHAGRHIHSVPPHVVDEFSATHYTGNDWAGVQTHA
jgi:hypothetical protein